MAASAKTKARLKALRRKHGLGEFRKKGRATARTRRIKRRRDVGMVKRRTKRRVSRRSGGLFGNALVKQAIGVGGYIAFETIAEPILANWIPNQYMDVAELVIGAYFMRKSGVIGAVAKAAVTINTYSLMRQYITPQITQATSGLFQ